MASDNLSTLSGTADDDTYGFHREEMYQSNLAGTVTAYDRHVFLCYKTPESWPSHLESSDSDLLPKLLSAAIKARKDDISLKTKLTMFSGRDETGFSYGDVLIFPDMIKYSGLKDSDVDGFVDDVLVNNKPWASGVPEVFTSSHVFVCVHASRDRRCGVCGPILVQKLDEEIELRGLKDQVYVSPCSHIGGHKYAGNLIIYQPGADGKTTGHWYGYVTPEDLPELFEQHIAKGKVVERLLRGQMGTNPEEVQKEGEQKLPNGEDTKENKVEIQENGNQSKVEPVASCCQGSNGFTCCRDESSGKSSSIEEKPKEISNDEQVPTIASKFSCWTGKWEQSEILTAVAVVGAVATVAVAYSIYRRSGCFIKVSTMADEGSSSRKRKRAKRRGTNKSKVSTNNLPDATEPTSQDIVVSASSDGKKTLRVSGSSSFLDKMRARLSGGHFRMLNEKLYTCTGEEALNYFKEDKVLFDVYHTGYQEQMTHWPELPVNLIIKWLKEHDPSFIVADFGCGDARLSKNVKNKVFSFDLVSKDPSVIACDMSNTPLDSASVDVAVFCLSLMGVNYASYLAEARRVLKPRGWLLISEVKSRFDPSNGGADPKKFIKAVCELGFVSALKDFSNKMFILLYFKKKDEKTSEGKDIDWPQLKPCMYKRR